MSRYRLGCTGWGWDDWRGGFYPPGTPAAEYLKRYARVFQLVEVDSSYYAAPRREQVERWARETPPGFTFTLKVPGDITHKSRLRETDDLLDRFLVALAPLRTTGKLGPLVLQLPASFRRERDLDALRAFLERFPRDTSLAVELRDASWWRPETYRLLEEHGAALVWSATEHGRAPPVVTTGFVYARLIHDRALTRFHEIQRDLTDEMQYWKARFEDEGRSARTVYVLVNNHFMGFAPASLARFARILGEPAPDLAAAQRASGQARLGERWP